MQIFWLLTAVVVSALVVATAYEGRLRALRKATVSREVFDKVINARSKQEHDLQLLHTRNHELLGQVENLQAQITGMPARLEELESRHKAAISRADGLKQQKESAIEGQRQAAEALIHSDQQLGEARAAQEVTERVRAQLKVDLEQSKLCSEELQRQLSEEQHRAEAQLEEARNVTHDHQQSRRDLLAELLFLEHYFGEAGAVARGHWQSSVFDSSKELFEREADLALSTHPDKWPVNGDAHNYLAVRDDLVVKVG
jgi:chromosome segregation ATPase